MASPAHPDLLIYFALQRTVPLSFPLFPLRILLNFRMYMTNARSIKQPLTAIRTFARDYGIHGIKISMTMTA